MNDYRELLAFSDADLGRLFDSGELGSPESLAESLVEQYGRSRVSAAVAEPLVDYSVVIRGVDF